MRRCGQQEVVELNGAQQLPLGVLSDIAFPDHAEQLRPGDHIIFYTDGITEAASPDGEMFGTKRLDEVLSQCSLEPAEIIESVRNHLTAPHRRCGDPRRSDAGRGPGDVNEERGMRGDSSSQFDSCV